MIKKYIQWSCLWFNIFMRRIKKWIKNWQNITITQGSSLLPLLPNTEHLKRKVNNIQLKSYFSLLNARHLQLLFHQRFLKSRPSPIRTLSSSSNSTSAFVFHPDQLWILYSSQKVQSISLSSSFQKRILINFWQSSPTFDRNRPKSKSILSPPSSSYHLWWFHSTPHPHRWKPSLKIFCFFWFFCFSTKHRSSVLWKFERQFSPLKSWFHDSQCLRIRLYLFQSFGLLLLQQQACNWIFYHLHFLAF